MNGNVAFGSWWSWLVPLALVAWPGCSGGDGESATSAGGSAGGAVASGGGPGSGSTSSTANGGTSGSGNGGTAPGGNAATGGARPPGGGTTAAGGAAASGGATAAGGATTNGGMTAAGGGAPSMGGANGAGGANGSGGSPAACTAASDPCPMPTGLSHDCKKRFALGINYAWHNFGTDFGGLAAWSQKGISQSASTYDDELGKMHAQGVSAIRWWMFPDFRGDGVVFDGSGDPSGVSSTLAADIDKALELANKNGVYLVLTIFSFDGFRPERMDNGIRIRSLSPIVSDATRRKKLVDNVVRPVARAAAASANAAHLLGWDIINEPEWAISATGNAPGGQDFSPNSELTAVSLANMKALINESAAVLKQEAPMGLTSVGWAAAKWVWAFGDVNLDFDQPHIYGWVDQYWPYTKSPTELGYTKRPVVMGEFYLRDMPFSDGGDNATYAQILESWWNDGYSGAWAWQYNETPNSPLIQAFKTSKGCPAGF